MAYVTVAVLDSLGRFQKKIFSESLSRYGRYVNEAESRQRGESLLNFFNRLRDLRPARRVFRELQLTLQLGARELQRLALPHALRIFLRLAALRRFPALLQFFHPFLEARISID